MKREVQKAKRINATITADSLFAGSGEMRALCRALNWAATPLGDVSGWSQSLRTTAQLVLACRNPMFLFWGPELVQLYNDAYRPSYGEHGRHPGALGMRGRDGWPDVWEVIEPQLEQVMTGGEATWHEDQYVPILRNGRLDDVWWTYSYSPVRDDDGTIGGTLVVCQETTGRVRAEAERAAAFEEIRRVFSQAPVAIAVLRGRELRYVMANPTYQRIIGGRDPSGMTLIEMFPELAGSEIERVLTRVFDTGTPFAATDLLIRFDSQGAGALDNYYDLLYHPILTDQGTATAIAVIAVDVTARHNSVEERERLLAQAESAKTDAEAANLAKSEFLAVMSHELRTPLNAIGGYAELIELGIHGPVTPEQAKALVRIQQSKRHLLGLINGVLDYARVEAGAVQYEVKDVSIDAVLAACEALVAPQARAKGITLTYLGVDPAMAARADREKLQQIVLNLLSNAIKFTRADGVVTLAADHGDGLLSVRVTDTGRGIATGDLTRVFLPFVQAEGGLTRTQEGTGLGLAISRDLARGMGGELTGESTLGVGSTFTVTLPLAQPRLSPLE